MGGFFSHYDLNDYVKPYLDFSFMRDSSFTAGALGRVRRRQSE